MFRIIINQTLRALFVAGLSAANCQFVTRFTGGDWRYGAVPLWIITGVWLVYELTMRLLAFQAALEVNATKKPEDQEPLDLLINRYALNGRPSAADIRVLERNIVPEKPG